VEHLTEFLGEELGGGLRYRACVLHFDDELAVRFPARRVVLWPLTLASLLRAVEPESSGAGRCCLKIMGWGSVSCRRN